MTTHATTVTVYRGPLWLMFFRWSSVKVYACCVPGNGNSVQCLLARSLSPCTTRICKNYFYARTLFHTNSAPSVVLANINAVPSAPIKLSRSSEP
jgi:hypothetical protein